MELRFPFTKRLLSLLYILFAYARRVAVLQKKNWNSTDREKTTDTVPLAYFATRGTRPRQGDLEIECRRRASSSALEPIHTHIHLQRVRTRSWIHFTDLWDLNGAFDRRIQPMHSTCHLPVVPRWGSWCRAACLPSCH